MASGWARFGPVLAGVSGVVLVAALFLPWYGVEAPGFSDSGSAWQELAVIHLLLLLVALLAIGWLAALATDALPADAPAAAMVAAAGLLGSVLIVFRIVDLPTPEVPARFEGVLEYGLRAGAFAGLAAAAGIALGGLLALRSRPATERG